MLQSTESFCPNHGGAKFGASAGRGDMFKFIHAADIHLDSPLRGLERYEGAPVDKIRGATREALVNLVDLAIAERAAFLLIAGDLYDGDWRDYNTGLFFASQMTKLREAGVMVVTVSGNHDAGSQISRQLRMPDNVRGLSSKKPESVFLENLGVAIHGQSFPKAATTEDLSCAYPGAVPGLFNIGLLHTSATGREGHEPYAPCTVDDLRSKGYDYWALGHIHRREVLSEDPLILFPGNIQGRHIRETGAKGCTIITVEDREIASAEHRQLDVLRWSLREIDATESEDADAVTETIGATIREEMEGNDGRPVAMRILITGACKAQTDLILKSEGWINEVRMIATDLSGGNVWVEKIKVGTRIRVNLEDMVQRDDPLGGLLRSIQLLRPGGEALDLLLNELNDLKRKLPIELQQGEDAADFAIPRRHPEIIEDVKQMLIARLLHGARSPQR